MSPSPCAGMDRLVQDVLLSQAGEIAGTLLGKWRGLGQVGFGLFGLNSASSQGVVKCRRRDDPTAELPYRLASAFFAL